jgi:hypothetical protein
MAAWRSGKVCVRLVVCAASLGGDAVRFPFGGQGQ